jgi:Ca-activated chloride channel family protein
MPSPPPARPLASTAALLPPPPPHAGVAVPGQEPTGTEGYRDYGVNPVTDPKVDRLSTFAVDVDTASYTITRRKLLRENVLPPYAAVRAEEFLNYFGYDYAPPKSGRFTVHLAGAPSPYEAGHHLLRVAVQGRKVTPAERAPVHLVYLVDVSGSMSSPDRIGYAKQGLRMLTSTLKPGDTVAISTYAGGVREILPPTGAGDRARILAAIDSLSAGGSTAMASGIQLAYDLASKTAQQGHVSRVVVLSDGDANVGASSPDAVVELIKRYRGRGITLSTVGFGSGNYKDVMMERLADAGDGNYTYIDAEPQLRRVFAEQADGMLQVIARDVKVQVEFDPQVVKQYRLVGYENRDVADKDFRNDKVDAGEIGAGHAVTALYDVVLARTDASPLVVRVRSKAPETHRDAVGRTLEKADEQSFRMTPQDLSPRFDDAPASLRFQTAVAGFAEILRKSPAAREWRLAEVDRIALASSEGKAERVELSQLVRAAARLSGQPIGDAIAR